MRIHIMGVAGTFMAGLARIAKQLGHDVTGSDKGVIYPPMSTQLEDDGIKVFAGYDAANLDPRPDLVIVGNAVSRGNPEFEALLNSTIPYVSGPQWLYEHVLREKHVLAVSGTHGKTSTTTMLTRVLLDSGIDCGYLIGGVPRDLPGSATLGNSPYFVIEADEYDSALFDKRSKFMHYHPRTLILNNLEFDHADIFKDLDAIKAQFHHMIRTIPSEGLIVANGGDENIKDVLSMGSWTPIQTFDIKQGDWTANLINADGSEFEVFHQGQSQGSITWALTGEHNVANALATIVAANHINVPVKKAIESLCKCLLPKRRMEIIAEKDGVTIYDDFAHHPTAFEKTLQGLRAKVGDKKIIVCLEMRSFTMRTGHHGNNVMKGLDKADEVLLLKPEAIEEKDANALSKAHKACTIMPDVDTLMEQAFASAKTGDHIVLMSNGSFDGLREKIVQSSS